jgi:hypothetical protein
MDKTNYIICPDSECTLFWKPDCPCPCDGKCPHGDKMNIVIKCNNCGKEIPIPHDHFMFCRVECDCCGAWHFHRMSGIYKLRRKDEAEL